MINFGTVNYNGQTLTLTQDAYPSDDGCTYKALASDPKGTEYYVYWEINHPSPHTCEDGSEMCDWDTVLRIEAL